MKISISLTIRKIKVKTTVEFGYRLAKLPKIIRNNCFGDDFSFAKQISFCRLLTTSPSSLRHGYRMATKSGNTGKYLIVGLLLLLYAATAAISNFSCV